MEEWRSVIGYEGLYEVSSLGQVMSYYTGRILKPKKDKYGYYQVCLCKDGKKKTFLVHRLVYEAFCGKIPDGLVIDHINTVRNDNRLENLRCVTPKENSWNPVTRPRLIHALRNKSPEWRRNNAEATRKAMRKRSQNQKWRKNVAEAMRKLAQDQGWRKNVIEANRKRSQNQKWRKNVIEANRKRLSKSIIQLDKTTGEIIKHWGCIMDVQRQLGIANSHISACCRGKKNSAGGFKWQYS